MAIGAAIVAGVAAIGSNVNANRARGDQRAARKIQDKVRQTQDARSRMSQVREARMAQAQVLQGGATQGALNSSAVQGGYSAIGSNAENNIQFINQIDSMQQAINRRMEDASKWQSRAAGFSAISSIAGSMTGGPAPQGATVAGGTAGSNYGAVGGMNNANGMSSSINTGNPWE